MGDGLEYQERVRAGVGIILGVVTRLLDSVILIDHLNGLQEATQFVLAVEPEQTAISVITRAEILVGVEAEDAALVKALLDQFHLLIIDKPIADLAADMRKTRAGSCRMPFRPRLCIYHKIKLVTRNTKDFDPGPP